MACANNLHRRISLFFKTLTASGSIAGVQLFAQIPTPDTTRANLRFLVCKIPECVKDYIVGPKLPMSLTVTRVVGAV